MKNPNVDKTPHGVSLDTPHPLLYMGHTGMSISGPASPAYSSGYPSMADGTRPHMAWCGFTLSPLVFLRVNRSIVTTIQKTCAINDSNNKSKFIIILYSVCICTLILQHGITIFTIHNC